MLVILYLQRSIFLYRHQTTSPYITIIHPTDYLKASIVIEFAECEKGRRHEACAYRYDDIELVNSRGERSGEKLHLLHGIRQRLPSQARGDNPFVLQQAPLPKRLAAELRLSW